jgi:hypothetical protein
MPNFYRTQKEINLMKKRLMIGTLILLVFSHPIFLSAQTLPYTVTATAGDNGLIYPSGTQVVFRGADYIWEINPEDGYEVDTFTDNGADKKSEIADSKYTLTNIQENHDIEVTFKPKDSDPDPEPDPDFICADTAEGLQDALNAVVNNGQDDEIRIVQGIYTGNFTYAPREENKLTVKGGYTAGCEQGSRSEDPSKTVLDGSSEGSVFTVSWNETTDFALEGVTLQNGSASVRGGNFYFLSTTANVTLQNNIIQSGRTEGFGGGADIRCAGTVTLIGNTFTLNQSGYGGGITIGGDCTVTFDSNVISHNAANSGGGLFIGSQVTAVLTNNLILQNSDQWYDSGGVYVSADEDDAAPTPVTLTHNTITGNTGGIYIQLDYDEDRADIYNNIIYGNQEKPDIQIFNDGNQNGTASPANIFNNLFNHETGFSATVTIRVDESNLNKDPKFADSKNGNYRLKQNSPCIEAGINNAPGLPATDKDGNPRIVPDSGSADMGAYEYVARKGNLNTDNRVNLKDGILAIQAACGGNPAIRNDYVSFGADVSGNGKAGLEEAVYVFNFILELE